MLDEALHAIAEPRRRTILSLIRDGERTSTDIATYFPVTRPAISQHLGVLEAAGLVSVRREGTRRFYRARAEGLSELREFIETFWDQSLQRLARAAEAEERRLGDGDTTSP
jgi:DNA-binding transcriptional ArsR family regulator